MSSFRRTGGPREVVTGPGHLKAHFSPIVNRQAEDGAAVDAAVSGGYLRVEDAPRRPRTRPGHGRFRAKLAG